MAIQYYMRGFNTQAPGAIGFVDWVVNDTPDSTATFIQSPFVPANITNITVNKVVQSRTDNFLQPDQGFITADGYFFHLNSFDQLHASVPAITVIPTPPTFVGIAVTRGGTTNAAGKLLPGAGTNFFSTLLWDETVQRWKFIQNTNGDHVTMGSYQSVNTGDLTIDGYLAVGTLPALSGVIRIPNNLWIEARRNTAVGDGYLIRLDTTDRVQIGTVSETPIVYMPGNLRVDGYIRDGSAAPALSGFIRNGNNTTIMTARDQGAANDLILVSTNNVANNNGLNNNLVLGNATATMGNIFFNTSTSNVHQFQTNTVPLLEIGTLGAGAGAGAGIGPNNFIRFFGGTSGTSVVAPTIYQSNNTTNSATGQTLTFQAQNATGTTSVGGAAQIKSGTGTTAHGTIDFVTGNDGATPPKMRIFPTVDATAANNNSILFSENLFRVDTAQVTPRLRQDDKVTNAGTGETFTIQAQNETGTTSTGGLLNLTSGTGTTIAGAVNLQTGGVSKFTTTTTRNIHHNDIEEFDNARLNPTIRQDADTTSSGVTVDTLTLQAQNATGATTTGGGLVLTSGTGTTAAGIVDVQTGTISRMLITPGSPAATTATALFHINQFQVDTVVPSPTWKQNDVTTPSTNGQTFSILAQNATGTTSIGGDLVLAAGGGTTRDGYVRIRTDGVDRVAITQTQTVVYGDLLVLGTSTTINSTVVDLADRVIHVNSTAASYPTPTPAPTQITGFSVDRGTVGGPAKRDYHGLFWYEPDGYWRFAANTDGYAPGVEQTLAQTLPVIASTYLAQPLSLTVAAAIPTVGGFRALNNTVALASRNVGATANLILVSTDATNHLIWGASTNNAGHIFNTTSGTIYDFQVAGVSTYTLTPVSSGTTTLQATSTITSLVYRQADTGGATGANTTVQAQNAATTGGNLVLTSGTGATAGNVQLQTGAVDRLVVHPTFTEFRDAAEAYRITPVSSGATTLQAALTATSVTYRQADLTTASGTGATTTVQAQNETGTTSTGGALTLTSGTGTTTNGAVNLQAGAVTTASVVTNKFVFNKGWRRNITNVSGTLTVVDGYDYLAITQLTVAFTITLPATPTVGDSYTVKDTTGNAATFNVTIAGNGNNIDGISTFLLSQPYAAATFTFAGGQWSVT